MAQFSRIGAYAGAIAAASMTIAPAHAAEVMPAGETGTIGYASAVHADFSVEGAFDSSTYDEQAGTAEWRGRRYLGRRGYRRGRVRGSDVLAGVLILGGIAAVASAASNSNRRERENRRYEERRDDSRYDDRRDDRSNPRSSGGSGLDSAVSQCLTEIERDVRVDSVDGASRLPQGWVVTGTLFNGSGFTCQIGNNGQISNVDYSGFSGSSYDGTGGAYQAGGDTRQLTDGRYADARAALRGNGPASQITTNQTSAQPAYPGGPLPGETFAE